MKMPSFKDTQKGFFEFLFFGVKHSRELYSNSNNLLPIEQLKELQFYLLSEGRYEDSKIVKDFVD